MIRFTSYAAQRTFDGSRKSPAPLSILAAPLRTADDLTPDEYLDRLYDDETLHADDVALLHRVYADGYQGQPVAPSPSLVEQFAVRNRFLTGWYQSASSLAIQYSKVLDERQHLQRLYDTLNIDGPCGTFSMTMDDEAMEAFAKRIAKLVTFYRGDLYDGFEEYPAFVESHAILVGYGLRTVDQVPDFEDPLAPRPSHMLNRYSDDIYIVRLLRSVASERLFDASRLALIVSRGRQCYVPDYLVSLHQHRQWKNRQTLSGLAAYNIAEPFEGCDLIQAIDASVSNPANRRAELMTRLRGCENVAREMGHAALFVTVTCPSRFHPVRSGTGGRLSVLNPAWVDAGMPSVRDAHKYLTGVWEAVRKSAGKAEIPVYGFRFVEPHHSGTPHWHMILFVPFGQANEYRAMFRKRALLDSPTEPGANKHRFTCKPLNLKTGSAVGYCSKYIAKNIDGFAVGEDKEAQDHSMQTAQRVVAWASANRIRQFQPIGGPSVTVWRELRRMANQDHDMSMNDLTQGEYLLLEACRRAADAGDWSGFCSAMGGIHTKRADHTMSPHYSTPKAFLKLAAGSLAGKAHPADVDYVLTKSDESRRTQYGDRASASIDGVMFKSLFIATRLRQYRIVSKEEWEATKQRILASVRDYFELAMDNHDYFAMEDQHYRDAMDHFYEDERLSILFLDEEDAYLDWLARGMPDGKAAQPPLDPCQ